LSEYIHKFGNEEAIKKCSETRCRKGIC